MVGHGEGFGGVGCGVRGRRPSSAGFGLRSVQGFSLVLYKITISIIKLGLQEKTGKLL